MVAITVTEVVILAKLINMKTRDFFIQRSYKIEDLGEGKNYIFSNELLDLIKNEEVKDYVIEKYDLDNEIKIEFEKIDLLMPVLRKYVDRFSLLRLDATDNNVTTLFANNEQGDVIFNISDAELDGVAVDELDATAIYDSVSMFYEGRRLSQYINYLKNGVRDNSLLSAVNDSWKKYYKENDKKLKQRVYRVLHDKTNDDYFLKSINSEQYREYGIAETFVLAILELHRIGLIEKTSFKISTIALSESKIEMILRDSRQTHVKGLGYIHSSISIRNQDQGNTSIGVYSSLEFKLAHEDEQGKLYFFPNKKAEKLEVEKTIPHTVTVKNFVDSYSSIYDFFHDVENFTEDFFFLKDAATPDELRFLIEEKITGPRSPFKGVKGLQDLFTRDTTTHVDNLATLLKLCGRAEMIEMGYDLKFKLRYLISNVLLYGNNKMD